MSQGQSPNGIVLGSPVVNTTVVGTLVATYVCPSDNTQPSAVTGNQAGWVFQNARPANYLLSAALLSESYCPGGRVVGLHSVAIAAGGLLHRPGHAVRHDHRRPEQLLPRRRVAPGAESLFPVLGPVLGRGDLYLEPGNHLPTERRCLDAGLPAERHARRQHRPRERPQRQAAVGRGLQQPAPRRGQHADVRRLGPVRQELGQPLGVVGVGDNPGRRDRLRRLILKPGGTMRPTRTILLAALIASAGCGDDDGVRRVPARVRSRSTAGRWPAPGSLSCPTRPIATACPARPWPTPRGPTS